MHARCKGAYAVTALIAGYGLLAFRDPYGIRPLVIGINDQVMPHEYIVASESVAIDTLGFHLLRDVAPGEAVFIDYQRKLHSQQCSDKAALNPCIFEYVYLARPDSVMDGVSVYSTRLAMGVSLAEKIKREFAHLKIDVVIPIPDTSRPSALQLANHLDVPYREGFIKNRYIGRTFIMPGQALRKKSVRQKLNAIGEEFKGKNVLLVDDSIVRGTTSREIVQMARDAGAAQVYFASASPPVRFPNVYGIDMPTRNELIANGRTDRGNRARDRLRRADLPGSRRHGRRGARGQPGDHRLRHLLLRRPLHHRRRHAGVSELRRGRAQRRNAAAVGAVHPATRPQPGDRQLNA